MTRQQLIEKLKSSYEDSKKTKDVVVKLHLFGIKYAEPLSEYGSLKSIAKDAGIPESYATELQKAINLSKYVRIVN